MRLLSGMTLPPSTAGRGVGEFISSLPECRANLFPPQAKEKGSMMSGGFGRASGVLFAKYNLDSCSWKKCQVLSDTALDLSSMTLPRAGTLRNGMLFQRRTSAHRTGGRGCGFSRSWETPLAGEKLRSSQQKAGSVHSVNLPQMVNWPTPDTAPEAPNKNSNKRNAPKNFTEALNWPTATSRDWKDTGSLQNVPTNCLLGRAVKDAAYGLPDPGNRNTGGSSQGRLNPRWVEALMGLPPGWCNPQAEPTNYACWETAWFRHVRQLLSHYCGGG